MLQSIRGLLHFPKNKKKKKKTVIARGITKVGKRKERKRFSRDFLKEAKEEKEEASSYSEWLLLLGFFCTSLLWESTGWPRAPFCNPVNFRDLGKEKKTLGEKRLGERHHSILNIFRTPETPEHGH